MPFRLRAPPGCLQAVARRVRHPRIFVAFILADLLLSVGGSRINRRADGAGERVGLLTGVDGAGGKTLLVRVGRFGGHKE